MNAIAPETAPETQYTREKIRIHAQIQIISFFWTPKYFFYQ
jgi:hypothetical protein